jgi:hypothetical protein
VSGFDADEPRPTIKDVGASAAEVSDDDDGGGGGNGCGIGGGGGGGEDVKSEPFMVQFPLGALPGDEGEFNLSGGCVSSLAIPKGAKPSQVKSSY